MSYIGELLGCREGKGKMIFTDGSTEAGYWKKDIFMGEKKH